jgi:cytochrome c biogenesis protein CcmG, thiol:disulfide interchange protein DsbE
MDSRQDLLAAESTPLPGRRLSLGSILLLLGVVMVAVVFGFPLARQNQNQPVSGPAPDFTLTTLDGQQLHLADLKGKVVVVNFWASWCGSCREEASALQTVWQQYKDKGVLIVGIAYTDTERNAHAFISEYGQNYPNGLDIGTKISDLYNIEGVPVTFIINRKGEIAEFMKVPVTRQTLSDALERVLRSSA